MTSIYDTGFRNAAFKNCKILGVDFTRCNKYMFSFSFDNCIMDYCTFYGTKLKKTKFLQCSLKEVDFSETDLTSALFTKSDLTGAVFSKTLLEKADFKSATNISIDPEFNTLKKAKFSAFQLEGLLLKYQLDIQYDN
ncbi:pentapeptide repeat-containing protein [Pedobacter sp. UYP30]|uniref:pentapeptide repeat-containing protein n=1 Tax=Pedobacter sp. UYP30 TaxID=1756400 RepID=UPI003391F126